MKFIDILLRVLLCLVVLMSFVVICSQIAKIKTVSVYEYNYYTESVQE